MMVHQVDTFKCLHRMLYLLHVPEHSFIVFIPNPEPLAEGRVLQAFSLPNSIGLFGKLFETKCS